MMRPDGTEYEKDFAKLYHEYLEHLDTHLANEIRNGYWLFFWLMALKPEKLLEIGAGSGKACVIAKRLLPRSFVVASDVDPKVCEVIKEIAKRSEVDIKVECFNGFSVPYPNDYFCVCFSCGLVEHFPIEKIQKLVREHLRVAKYVIIEVPTAMWFVSNMYSRGDEVKLSKVEWLSLFNSVARIEDFGTFGPFAEEYCIVVILTKKEGVDYGKPNEVCESSK